MTDSTDRPDEGPSDIAGTPRAADSASRGEPENPWTASRPFDETRAEPVTGEADAETTRPIPETAAASVAPEGDGSSFRAPERRRGLLVPVVAAAVVAALIGGGAGAGIALAVRPADQTTSAAVTTTTGGASTTINNAKTATAISAVAAKASPSVVTISVNASTESGTGSGIVLSSDGYVLTNNHVVTLDGDSSSGTITATSSDGRIYKATIVGTDPVNDLAVIRLTGATGMTPATFADSSALNVGDTAIAIGAPLDLPGTVTTGIVSALNRSISIQSSAVPSGGDASGGGNGDGSDGSSPFNFWNFGNGDGSQGQGQATTSTNTISLAVIQTDAAINPGNSGGALLDGQGQVIGVNVAIASTGSTGSTSSQSGSIGVGFAIPSNVAKRIADELIQNKKATHGLLGATVADSSSSASSTVAGALVHTVSSGGAAAAAGLEANDIVTRFNGVTIQSATDLTAQVRALPGGASAQVVYVRGGTSHTTTVKLGTYSG